MFSVAMLVGSEDNQGALVKVAADAQRDNLAASAIPSEATQDERPNFEDSARNIEYDFSDDGELIDDAGGFDPIPESEQPFDTEASLNDDIASE